MKIIRKAIFTAAFLSAVCGTAVSAKAAIEVEVNNIPIEFDTEPVILNERTMIPIRAVAEKMGLSVSWDSGTQTAFIRNYEHVVLLTIGSNKMQKDAQTEIIDTAPVIINDRTCLPLRAVAEAFDAEVLWDGERQLITIHAPEYNKLLSYDGAFASGEVSYYYEDMLFDDLTQDSPLKKLSAVAALAANSEKCAREFETQNGFTEIKTYNYDKDSTDKASRTHKSDFVFAKKQINGKTIISVIIRGTNGNEWYSNFDVYEDTDKPSERHYGFYTAAREVYEKLNEYRNGEDAVVWISGHSRGGAVANLLGEMLYADNCEFAAYTFASPNVTAAPKPGIPVYNFIRERDIITHIPCWNYKRNGTDIVLNTINTDVFSALTGERYKGMIDITDTIAMLEAIAGDAEQYYNKENNGLTMYSYFEEYIAPMLIGTSYSGLKMMFDPTYGSITSFFVTHSSGTALKSFGVTVENEDNANGIPFEHCIEAYISSI